jgi:site-specific recombinase XerD
MPTTQHEIHPLTAEELIRLRRSAEARALHAKESGTVTAIRSWALLDTLLSSGLRASEVAGLRLGDCLLGYGQSALVVRQGKGGKTRARGEDVSNDAPVFTGQRVLRRGRWSGGCRSR